MGEVCGMCGGNLCGARAVLRGYGWRCYAEVLRVAGVLSGMGTVAGYRAAEALLQGGVVRHAHARVWYVVGSTGERTYLTHPNGCTCDAGLHSRVCWHRTLVVALAA